MIASRAIGNGIQQINVQQPSEPIYIGRSRLPDEDLELLGEEVDVNAIEFRYVEQINDALIPGQQLRLEYIEPFEEEMGEGLLVHVPNVNLPQLINLNDIDNVLIF